MGDIEKRIQRLETTINRNAGWGKTGGVIFFDPFEDPCGETALAEVQRLQEKTGDYQGVALIPRPVSEEEWLTLFERARHNQ